jgi:hypothetical protein
MARIELQDVTKVYGGNVRAVDSLSLDIADGDLMVLVGALLHLISLRHREVVARSGVRSPRQARRTRPPSAEPPAPRPQARSGLVVDSARSHARQSRSWRCGPA